MIYGSMGIRYSTKFRMAAHTGTIDLTVNPGGLVTQHAEPGSE